MAETPQPQPHPEPEPELELTPQPQPQPPRPRPPQPQLEIRFRIYYGAVLFQEFFPLSTTIESIKERIMSEWPQDRSVQPTCVDDIRFMHAGDALVTGRTIGESTFYIVPGHDVVTVLVVVLPLEVRRRRAVDASQDPTTGCTSCNLL